MPRYFEIDVTLQEIQPRIWRRLLIRIHFNLRPIA